MRRRIKKGRATPSANRSAKFSKKVTKQPQQSAEIGEEAEAVKVMGKRSCVHFDTCVDLDKLLTNIKSCEQIKCGECNEGLHVKKRSEEKVNSGKNKFSFSSVKAIWLCLECGHYICGGVGLPTESRSHVVQHIRLTRHRLVIQCENPRLRWCFACQSLLPFEKEEENGEKKDLLLEAVKLIKERYSNTCSALNETEDSYPISGNSIFGEIKLQGSAESNGFEARDGYAVRGLVNLGNTCFFNSVLQNLLSLDLLRDPLLKEDLCCGGPLVSSMKILFTEATSEAGLFRRVINPRAFFGSVCSKAPQFWGYQQHDSHELLRCLLDSLSIEESSLRKKLDVSSDSDDSSSHQNPTLVDSVFGGELSSTISCLECGHSSKVYEPFLDLSLPVPSRKPPPEKQQTLSQEKECEIPPKKVLKNMADSKDSEIVSTIVLDIKQVFEIATQADIEECDTYWWDTFGIDISNNVTDLVWQSDISDTASSTQSVVQTFVGGSGKLMHDNDGSAIPGDVPDQEDAGVMQSNKDTASSGISAGIVEAQVCNYPNLGQSSSSAKTCADEKLPLLVADSQVLYIPYKDDISDDDKTVAENKGEVFSSNADADVLDDSDSPVSVDCCLAQFTKPEIMSEDNAWHCENCSNNLKLQRLSEKINTEELDNGWVNENGAILASYEYRDDPLNQSYIDLKKWKTIDDDSKEVIVKRPAIKRVLVNKAPPVLTIHLKRFSQDALGKLSKLSGHVDFKEFIDLGQYMDIDSRWTEEDQPVYRLAGLVEHSGTMGRGHYVAYVRGDDKERRNSPDSSIWYRASDSFVRQVSFEQVLHSEAYILFYQRI